MVNRMILNETSYFGKGAINHIPDEVKARGFKKGLVITDKGIEKAGILEKITKFLDTNNLPYDVFADLNPNPSIEEVTAGVAAYHSSGADYILAVGGGSPIDTAKGIGIIVKNPEFADVRSLEGTAATKHSCVPILAVPTTSGTAAEVTINYVITDKQNNRKFVCADPHDIPVCAFVDSDMMMGMPKALCAATGMDALTHAIEGYVTKGAWEMTDMMHLKAIQLIAKSLRASVNEDHAARETMALAQYIAGMGFSNVGLGLVHGMAHPLSAWYNVPHGVACAAQLPTVMEYNKEFTGEKYRDIAAAFDIKDAYTMPLADARDAACKAVKQLGIDVGIPEHLADLGVKEADIPAIAKDALVDVCTGGNPRDTSVEDIEMLYRKMI